jgi:glycosyltransferase involved in cell wall biosynthesis
MIKEHIPRSAMLVEGSRQVEDCHDSMGDAGQSLSVVLPAYNEEQVIALTISNVLETLSAWGKDFEIIVVNDGSTDQTGAIVASFASADPRIRLVTHETNQGYGAALVSGFAAARKQFTFLMDSDGQFDIRDLQAFFPYIKEYDAIIGYRINRQDSWVRKFNALGWRLLIRLLLGVRARDIDCAFKLLQTEFLHENPLESRGATISAELLYKLKRAGCSYYEVGVHHLPRRKGRATGARPAVILRAFRELFTCARKWKREERQLARIG